MPLLATSAIAIIFLYLYKLDGVGVVGPDEPRYAAIGRFMAASGDLITPILWGKPWFEKPPLLYWMTAAGTTLGLGPDLCGRLPVVLLSLLFLGLTWFWTAREFGTAAGLVTGMALATSAGWLTYSSLCLTDLPLAVTFSLAVFLACSLLRPQPPDYVQVRFLAIGALIGLGILAKGLVPIVLAIPFFWYLRAYLRYWWLAIAATLVVALPWYWLVYWRNGFAFIDDFLIKHHFQRLYSAALLHTQPWYYYVPVLLAGLFPWTPLFGLLFLKRMHWDNRRRFLLATALFGFVFFSLTRNKLPHYVLPLLPSLFVLLGSWFEDRQVTDIPRGWLVPAALLLATIPAIAELLPPILAAGRLSRTALGIANPTQCFFTVLPLAAIFLVRRTWAAGALFACAIVGLTYLKASSYPVIDQTVSPRSFWLANQSRLDHVCNGGTNRDWLYGLNYYRGADFPECQTGHFDYALRTVSRGAPELTPLH